MPLFFQKIIDADTRLAIWRIEEEESFFLEKVSLHRTISHPHKRSQHLAGRYLLSQLFPDFPIALIRIADTLKPYLKDEAYHFSISHCADFAAAIVSKSRRVGVDVELVSHKVRKVQHKFLSEDEIKLVKQSEAMVENIPIITSQNNSCNELLTLLWSCKEAVFKWYGLGEIDFREQIVVNRIKQMSEHTYCINICFQKEGEQQLALHSTFFNHHEHSPNSRLPTPNPELLTLHSPLVLSYVFT
ncbi:MAG: 4'-phosphopantetheinyl transferase superfamily protein [Flavisolibacter sp.]|nr:4'-phosphopantetheinyl transferase superfamily protein [Flavisolibacter sp.]